MNIWACWLAELPASLQRLIARVNRVSLPRGADAQLRLQRLRAALCNPRAVREQYFALSPDQREALQTLRNTPRGISACALAAQWGPLRSLAELRHDPRPRSTAERLLLAGLLLPRPASPQHPLRYLLPPEVRRWLPTPLAFPDADVAPTTASIPAAHAAAVVLLASAEASLPLCANRQPTAAALRTLAPRLAPLPPEQAPALLDWLVPLLVELGLLVCHAGAATCSPRATAFLRRSPLERVGMLRAAWLRSAGPDTWLRPLLVSTAELDAPALRRRMLAWVSALPAGRLLDPDRLYPALVAAFGPLADSITHRRHALRRSPWGVDRSGTIWQAALRGPLTWLGNVGWEERAEGTDNAQNVGRCFVSVLDTHEESDDECAAPASIQPVRWLYRDAGRIAVPTGGLDADVARLVPFARWQAVEDGASIYRVDQFSLAQAAAARYDRSTLQALLEQRAGPLPDDWQGLLDIATPRVRIVHAAIALADDSQVLSRAAQQRSVRRHLAAELAPGVALVEPVAAQRLQRALAHEAIAVSLIGEAVVAPPAELSAGECELLLAACACYRGSGSSGGALDTLTERLAARLPPTVAAQLIEPPVAPAPARAPTGFDATAAPQPTQCHGLNSTLDSPSGVVDQPAILALLRDAIRGRRAVELLYQGANDTAPSARNVRPIRLELRGEHWYLEAYCLRKHATLTFRVDRIHKLTPGDARPRRGDSADRGRQPHPMSQQHRPNVVPRADLSGVPSRGAWLEE